MTGSGPPADLCDSALDNLVQQFARPLDCLRELVQNSIDAGSPRVEVTLSYTPRDPSEGTLVICVRDFGEGMDEHVIDHELTQMFASSKTGDLSKIGRFGIGFTSVFAIAPDAIHLQTGRHGSGWELVFHPDRSFDKIRLEQPISGTCISLYKCIPAHHRSRWQRDIEEALAFWCEHCSIPVTLEDRGLRTEAPQETPRRVDTADPFAAFVGKAPRHVHRITRPMDLADAEWVVRLRADGIEAMVGLSQTPTYRWYNGGLTLLSTTDPACLGPHEAALGHLSFKIQHQGLEHTLTRDNVIQDDHWQAAIDLLHDASLRLEARILAAHEAEAAAGGHLLSTLEALARIAKQTGRIPGTVSRQRPVLSGGDGLATTQIFAPTVSGAPVALFAAPHAEWAVSRTPLTDALESEGHTVLLDLPAVRALAAVAGRTLPGRVEGRWVLVELVDLDDALNTAIGRLLRAAGVTSLTLRWCEVHADDPPMVILQAPRAPAMRRDRLDADRLSRLLGVREAWVNVAHPNTRLAQRMASIAPRVAAFAILQASFAHWGGLSEPRFSRIRSAAGA